MTKSRLALLAGTVVVVLGMLAGLGALLLNPARASVGPLPASALVLPADARYVVGFDVKRFTSSPFYTRYASRGAMKPQAFGELEQQTGIDPARDLDQVVLVGTGTGSEAEMVALAIGRFDLDKLGQTLEAQGKASAYRHEGARIWAFKAGPARAGQGGPTGKAPAVPPRATALASLSRDTLVFGSQRRVEAAVANRKRGLTPLRSNELLVRLAEQVRPGSAFWMVGDGSLLASLPSSFPAPGAAPGGGAPMLNLPALRSLSVTGDLDPVVSLAIAGEALDEPAARNLADVVRGLVALATMQAQQKPELQQLASAVSVTTEANRVLLTARVPYELIDALTAAAQRHAPAPRRAPSASGAPEDAPAPPRP